jgi:FkbM family methyltransferase
MQKDFLIYFKDNLFYVEKEGLQMKFMENPYHRCLMDKDYFYKSSLEETDVVIDAGAYVGNFVVYASKKVGDEGKVFAFEPDPHTITRLRETLELNNLANVFIIDKGLWSEETTLTFEAGGELGSSFITEDKDSVVEKIEVPVTTIDEVLRNVEVKNKIFIKMNIEGSEIEAVKGAVNTIKKYKPHWAIRTDHFVDGEMTDKKVECLLKQWDYKTTSIVLTELTTFGEPN